MPKYNVSGWHRQYRDLRDYSISHPKIQKFFVDLPPIDHLPSSVDLRVGGHMPPDKDQGQYGTCTANAAAVIIDYCEHVANGQFLNPSRAFQYWNTEQEDGSDPTKDNGGTIRAALMAIVNEGAIPESWWPYDDQHIMHKPIAEDYDEGKNYLATACALIDQPSLTPNEVLDAIRQMLAGSWPLDFGTSVYNQIMQVGPDGNIAMPGPDNRYAGGHSMVVVGYDDAHKNLDATKGAFLIRNSWGLGWGGSDYGWMPYGYLTGIIPDGGMSDIWVLTKEGWIVPGPCPNPTPDPKPSSLTFWEIEIVCLVLLVIIAWKIGVI